MSAERFLGLVNEHLHAIGDVKQDYTTVAADPERGKHNTCYMITLFGICVDVLDIRQGNVVVDAQQRDLTVNAMFYNIQRGIVEDVTGMGLDDLRDHVLRTPVAPEITLAYDPLRAVRVARFACKLRYTVHPSLALALQRPQVREDLARKTARDRVGAEMKKALGDLGGSPALCIRVIVEAGLFGVVFEADEGEPDHHVAQQALARCDAVAALLSEGAFGVNSTTTTMTALSQEALFMAACLWHRAGRLDTDSKGRRTPAIQGIVVNLMRLSQQLAGDTMRIAGCCEVLLRMQLPAKRLELGRCLRQAGELWVFGCMLAASIVGAQGKPHVQALWNAVHGFHLVGCWNLKHILNGHEVGALLQLPKGPIFTLLMDRLMDEQLSHPDMTREQASEWLISFYRHQQQGAK